MQSQMSSLNFNGQKVGFDITIPMDRYDSWKSLYRKLKGYCKKFAFQLEQGRRTGYKHWQCRVSLITKRTAAAIVTELAPEIGGNWSLTSDTVHSGPKHFNYVMKEDTRIDGPWTDQTPCDDAPVMTRQLREFMKIIGDDHSGMYDFQKYLYGEAQEYNDRKITLIYDLHGHSGKSRIVDLLEYKEIALYVPPVDSMKDMSQYICCYETRRCYCIDLPRAMKKDKKALRGIYSGIELLKDGRMFDTRYAAKSRRIDCPQIFVFCNDLPDFDMLSNDRWEILEIQDDKRAIVRQPSYYTCRITR